MVSGQMTRGAAISMALLAIIVLALIVLLAWPMHSASAVTAAHVPFARSAIGCLMSPARCFATAPNLTRHWKAKKVLAKG